MLIYVSQEKQWLVLKRSLVNSFFQNNYSLANQQWSPLAIRVQPWLNPLNRLHAISFDRWKRVRKLTMRYFVMETTASDSRMRRETKITPEAIINSFQTIHPSYFQNIFPSSLPFCIALYLFISIAPLTAWALQKRFRPQQLTLCRSLHAEALQATASEGLAQGPYVVAIERDSNPQPFGWKASTLPMRHHALSTTHNLHLYHSWIFPPFLPFSLIAIIRPVACRGFWIPANKNFCCDVRKYFYARVKKILTRPTFLP